jgi:hypothetical protein
MFRNKIRFARTLTIAGVMCVAGHVGAKENVVTAHHKAALKTSETGCQPATASIDLDINNVRARLMTGGDMWWNIGSAVAAYEIPKGSGKSSQFAASCWIGGFDKQGQLKVAAQTYRQDGNDYWPGALNDLGKITADTCNLWDRFWKVDRSTINQFISMYKSGGNITSSTFDAINQWPASGNKGALGSDKRTRLGLNSKNTYAPFKDLNGDGLYQPDQGEYPLITGDQYIWWVFNDAGNVKQQSATASMGVEVQTCAFAYATQDFLNNATFCNYRVINRGALTIDSTYIAVWDDCDLGYYLDDYIGCDTTRGLGIQYNGTNDDGGGAGHPVNSYGLNPPQVGLDFFEGPKRPAKSPFTGNDTLQQLGMTNFTYYNNDFSVIGNPSNGVQIYFYMTGSIRNGQRFSDDFIGPGSQTKGYGAGPVSNFVFWGDPGDNSQWSECACNNNPSDRRFIFSSGPFQLLPGAINDITFGCVWAKGAGGCGAANFKAIKNIDDQAQALFDNHFKTVEGPEAPRLIVRELDRRLIFYMVNDQNSNNYGENYGRTDGTYKDSLQYHQVVVKAIGKPDSLYKFQGYRVFQLANSEVTSAEIFNPTTGEVDNTKAYEVFQCDVHDGVTQIVNYVKDLNIQGSDTTNIPQIKVNGRDSGITHSFVLTNDQFSTGSDKRFINYHNYYFVAIAYAYNNFAKFDPLNAVNTQDVAYLGSAHGAGGQDIKVVVALPNPANGAMGTVINSDYGSGVIITRVEGKGNGGNDVELDSVSEALVLEKDSIGKATYKINQGPINIKVVDPVKVQGLNWALQIIGNNTSSGLMVDSAKWKLTAYNDNNTLVETIYSEQGISIISEQIIEKYGISINVNQVKAPGVEPSNGNGYITSDVTFEDPTQPWLWGVRDQPDSNFSNWLRSGNTQKYTHSPNALTNPCNFNDYTALDINNNYENMLANFTPTKSTWGPYVLAAAFFSGKHAGTGTQCGFEVAYSSQTQSLAAFQTLTDLNLVFTSDKSKWTRCAVIEEQEDPALAQGFAGVTDSKFYLRKHKGWNGLVGADGVSPIYSDADSDKGMSWFPGYAIDPSTGRRLNIVFGEDSYLASDNGNDMIWNPTSRQFSNYDASILFGGKHIVYVLNTKYDSCKVFAATVRSATPANPIPLKTAYTAMQWVGMPTLNPSIQLLSLKDGIIPTKTTLRFRVNRPYGTYLAADTSSVGPAPIVHGTAANPTSAGNPYYTFNTKDLAPTALSDTSNRNKLLDRIYAVPNPYYGYSGYELNRFDTKVRIINLPAQVTINIYSLDGSLIRTLTKNDPYTSYIDWDIKNTVGLPIASGMYLMHVKAAGLGEVVLKWFGATRPIDVTSY